MNTLLFPILFLLLASVLLWIVIGVKGWLTAKMWLINITTFFVIILWFGVRSYMGWPADEHLPMQMRLMSFIANEPKSLYVIGEAHGEYDLFTHSWYDFVFYKPDDTARMFKMPYSKEAHQGLENAMEQIKKGGYVVLSRKPMDGHDITGDGEGSLTRDVDFRAYLLPPNKIMQKPQP